MVGGDVSPDVVVFPLAEAEAEAVPSVLGFSSTTAPEFSSSCSGGGDAPRVSAPRRKYGSSDVESDGVAIGTRTSDTRDRSPSSTASASSLFRSRNEGSAMHDADVLSKDRALVGGDRSEDGLEEFQEMIWLEPARLSDGEVCITGVAFGEVILHPSRVTVSGEDEVSMPEELPEDMGPK